MPAWQMHDHKMDKPTTDDEYFERMSRVILVSGLNWKTVETKWPGIKQAFSGFEVNTVADFEEPEIDALMANPAVIRNLAKIKAIIKNAREIQDITKEHGSVAKYLTHLRRTGGEGGLRESISKRFAFLGKGTTIMFLFSVGEDLPEAMKEWDAQHQG